MAKNIYIKNAGIRRKTSNFKPYQWKFGVKWQADDAALTVGDGKFKVTIPPEANGMNLVSAFVTVFTVSSSGNIQFQIRNETDSVDMLTTKLQIDQSERTSNTGTAYAIDTTYDDVATGDVICLDCDAAGTGAKGGEWHMVFEMPES